MTERYLQIFDELQRISTELREFGNVTESCVLGDPTDTVEKQLRRTEEVLDLELPARKIPS